MKGANNYCKYSCKFMVFPCVDVQWYTQQELTVLLRAANLSSTFCVTLEGSPLALLPYPPHIRTAALTAALAAVVEW